MTSAAGGTSSTSTTSSLACRPRWATPRRPDRPTQGPYVDLTARRLLGRPLQPWQTDLSDVAGEYDPATGRFFYSDVVAVVPRRAGKTLLSLATMLQRCNISRFTRAKFTAQTREDAARQFRLEWAPMLERAKRRRLVNIRRSNGSETITLARLGSTVELFAPTAAGAGHGHNIDIAVVDEVWWFTVDEGEGLEAGIRPAQMTRPLRQRWWITAGGVRPGLLDADITETFLDRLMDRGRAAVEADERAGICYVEYSADPLELGYDPYDPRLWLRTHPAIGHTIDVDAVADDARTMSRQLFERAVLNVWPRASGRAGMLTVEALAGLEDPAGCKLGRPLWFAVDITPDRGRAASAAAGTGGRGVALELVDSEPGADWVTGRLVELHRRHRSAGVVLDTGGPAGMLVPVLERAGVPLVKLAAADYAGACAALVDGVRARTITVNGHPDLTAAVAVAKSRPLGDAWAWGRRRSDGNIAPLVAITLAHRPAQLGWQLPRPMMASTATR
jgi:hypothetical protein